jgi:hypothetical protein
VFTPIPTPIPAPPATDPGLPGLLYRNNTKDKINQTLVGRILDQDQGLVIYYRYRQTRYISRYYIKVICYNYNKKKHASLRCLKPRKQGNRSA